MEFAMVIEDHQEEDWQIHAKVLIEKKAYQLYFEVAPINFCNSSSNIP
jgi:hypothetical protein